MQRQICIITLRSMSPYRWSRDNLEQSCAAQHYTLHNLFVNGTGTTNIAAEAAEWHSMAPAQDSLVWELAPKPWSP